MAERIYKIYSDGKRTDSEPFDGWIYFTEYGIEDGAFYSATGVNQKIEYYEE